MRIKSLKNCWTPSPEYKWSAGEVKDVLAEEGKKLLRNKNFIEVTLTKEETQKQNGSINRKTRSVRNRN